MDAPRTPSRLVIALLATSGLAGLPATAHAQAVAANAPAAAPSPAAAPAPAAPVQADTIRSITVDGAQRLEPDTILSYIRMRVGDTYTQTLADQALKDLFATELFADVQVRNNGGAVVIQVKENPVINRIILEGNKRIKDEKILPEIKLAARQIFTRSKVRADVARIIELYKRQGRFAASVEPKMVSLDQNRVDIVFEITEGPKSKVRQINIIGNEKFGAGELRGTMVTKQSRFFRLFSSGTSYDPDRLAFDQQKLRQFYLTQGYADFRVVSAVAELTPDKKDFIITYVVEEGQRYKFGDVKVDSRLRDFDGEALGKHLPMKKGDWYNAKSVEDTVDALSQAAGNLGYAFADVSPDFNRNKDDLTMGVTYRVAEAPRVYVERIDVNGNTLTQDKVVRREFRLTEGDAFNSFQVKRSTNRINSLGYFQEKFEVEQKPGSAPDRIVLEANVEEKPTGQLQLSAGFSSLESFILQASIEQRNFRGRGQTVGLSVDYSRYSRSVQASFTEPYLFDRNVSLGVDVYRRDTNSYNINNTNNTTYKQATTGFSARVGLPLTEYLSLVGSYTLNLDNVTLDKSTYYTDRQHAGILECDPLLAGRYLCDAIGKRTSSIIGATLIYDTLDNRQHPTRGTSASLGGSIAGLGGSVKYARVAANAARYWPVYKGFIFSISGEAGAIKSLQNRNQAGVDDIRLTDRFFLGEPQIRGFDIRGVGPRVVRKPLVDDGTGTGNLIVSTDKNQWTDDAIGGKYYYLAHAELEIPLGSGAKELGLRPSIFLDAGAVFGVRRPSTQDQPTAAFFASKDANGNALYSLVNADGTVATTTDPKATNADGSTVTAIGTTVPPFKEFYFGDSPKPRVSIGIGVNWNSPFGPFRIDVAKTLLKEPGDDVKTFTFNVGTQF
ncbi:outer membrane protein assembly factor BamA [Novosphingobium lentum]|uniref:outer membrane protein assembly factor BamA n=1 Tax=Novosphingobium lentum TaxID=145287 RepID=UPI00082A853D|nr:outer membrane protein assembly factor BamA [Novosphingobium lentum]